MQKIYTLKEAAEVLQVPNASIYSLARAGVIQAFKVGKHWRIPEEGLQNYVKKSISLYN